MASSKFRKICDQPTETKMIWYDQNYREKWIGKYTYDARGQLQSKNEREYYLANSNNTNSTMVYDTYYTFDKAGYLHKEQNEVSDKVYEDTYHYYNGMEQPGRMGEQLRSNDQPRFLSQDTYTGNAWELGCIDEQ